MHWARMYVGKPWAADGDGPVRFSCWGLVRDTFRREGVNMPALIIGAVEPDPQNVAGIKQAARASGMRPVTGEPRDGDIVLMRGRGHLHCGRVVVQSGRVRVLHSAHERGVTCDPWNEATEGMQIELWRRAA